MDEEQERVLLAITDTIFDGMDRVFRNTYALYADKLDNSDDIYQAFVVLMSQVLGRHLLATGGRGSLHAWPVNARRLFRLPENARRMLLI